MTTITPDEQIIIDPEYSEFDGTEFDPYRQMGVSGDTLEIYNDLIASMDRRLRRRVRSKAGILSDTHRTTRRSVI
jgi:hypothetical protein